MCSVGNVPLAAVLWNGGISFGGVTAFLFADLIIVPLVVVYAKYYGRRMAAFLAVTLFVAAVVAGYVVEIVFGVAGGIPSGPRHASQGEGGIHLNYTTALNVIFLLLAAALVVRFFCTGGRSMLSMMGGSPDETADASPDGVR